MDCLRICRNRRHTLGADKASLGNCLAIRLPNATIRRQLDEIADEFAVAAVVIGH